MSNYVIKTEESPVKADKNGMAYKTVGFTEVVMMQTPFGSVAKPVSQSRTTRINCYEQRYLDNKMDIGYNDPIFNPKNPQAGGLFQGSIEQRNVAPYEIDGREVTTFSTVVFGDTNAPAFESLVRAAFNSKGHPIVDAETAKELSQSTVAPINEAVTA